MRLRLLLLGTVTAVVLTIAPAAPAASGRNAQTAGLQVALRAQGLYRGPIDAISGPKTVAAVRAFQSSHGLPVTGIADARTRAALGPLGRPLFGARTLRHGAFGWDVAVLQFLLLRQGISVPVNAYFDEPTLHGVRLLQSRLHLRHDGVVGPHTLVAIERREPVPLARPIVVVRRQSRPAHKTQTHQTRTHRSRRSLVVHVVRAGESLSGLAQRYHTTVAKLAKLNHLDPHSFLIVGQKLRIPAAHKPQTNQAQTRQTHRALLVHVVRAGESLSGLAQRYHTTVAKLAKLNHLDPHSFLIVGQKLRIPAATRQVSAKPVAYRTMSVASVRSLLDYWAAHYGVSHHLVRALAWMESGYNNALVSNVGARGIMQLLPTTFRFAEAVLIGHHVTHNANGNVRAGVAYLAHLLHDFHGNARLALAGWYQGERAVRKHGVYKVSKTFVADVLALSKRM